MPGRKAPSGERRQQILDAAARVAVRRRLSGLTVRDVARDAGLSTGLVLFHFKSKAALTEALLEWLLDSGAVLQARTPPAGGAGAAQAFRAAVHAEARRLAADGLRTELFFDFWVAGTRTPGLRTRIRRALVRYRQQFRALAEAALAGTGSPPGAAEALGAAAVSFVQGCALQRVIDPRRFDLDASLAALETLREALGR